MIHHHFFQDACYKKSYGVPLQTIVEVGQFAHQDAGNTVQPPRLWGWHPREPPENPEEPILRNVEMEWHGCFQKIGVGPQNDENNGKAYDQMDDLGENPLFLETSTWVNDGKWGSKPWSYKL